MQTKREKGRQKPAVQQTTTDDDAVKFPRILKIKNY